MLRRQSPKQLAKNIALITREMLQSMLAATLSGIRRVDGFAFDVRKRAKTPRFAKIRRAAELTDAQVTKPSATNAIIGYCPPSHHLIQVVSPSSPTSSYRAPSESDEAPPRPHLSPLS